MLARRLLQRPPPSLRLVARLFSSHQRSAPPTHAAARDPTKNVKPNASLHASALTAPLPPTAAAALTNALAQTPAASAASAASAVPIAEDVLADTGPLPFGALAQLPLVPSAAELLQVAESRARRLTLSKAVSGTANKIRDISLRQLRVKAAYILYRIDRCIAAAPPVSRLHPFERTVVGLTLGPDTLSAPPPSTAAFSSNNLPVSAADGAVFASHALSGERAYSHALAGARSVRNRVSSALETHAAILTSRTRTPSLSAVRAAAVAAAAALDAAVADPAPAQALAELAATFRVLRRLNVVNPRLPTVALVGAPNVGKSSLVRVLSSGRPEVQNYPFTTRAVAVGHVTLRGREGTRYRCQVTDTPGLLPRRDVDRKKMELLTLAVLEHVPRLVVVFVVDPSGHCGTSLEEQLKLRQELRWRYHKVVPGERWIDVATKTDIWRDIRPSSSLEQETTSSSVFSPDAFDETHSLSNTSSNKKSSGVYRKPTTTSTPLAPSSLSVPPHWRLASALASLPARPPGFVDDDPALVAEVSVAAEPAAAVAGAGAEAGASGRDTREKVEASDDAGVAGQEAGEVDEGLGQLQGALAWALLDLCEPEDGGNAFSASTTTATAATAAADGRDDLSGSRVSGCGDEEVRSGSGGRASKKEEDAELKAWLAARAHTRAAAAAAAEAAAAATTAATGEEADAVGEYLEDEGDISGLEEYVSGEDYGIRGIEELLEDEGLEEVDIDALLGLSSSPSKAKKPHDAADKVE